MISFDEYWARAGKANAKRSFDRLEHVEDIAREAAQAAWDQHQALVDGVAVEDCRVFAVSTPQQSRDHFREAVEAHELLSDQDCDCQDAKGEMLSARYV
jgi:hypothetical protein